MDPTPISPAPPTAPGPLNEGVRSAWPTVLGTLSTVFGGLALLGGICGTIVQLFMGPLMSSFAGAAGSGAGSNKQGTALPDAMRAMLPYQLLNAALMVGAGALLLVAGIGLLQRRAWSIKASKVWAILKMIFVVISAVVGFFAQQAMMRRMQSDPAMAKMPTGFMFFGGLFGAAFALVWGWAYPLFMLVWLHRPVIKQETATWK